MFFPQKPLKNFCNRTRWASHFFAKKCRESCFWRFSVLPKTRSVFWKCRFWVDFGSFLTKIDLFENPLETRPGRRLSKNDVFFRSFLVTFWSFLVTFWRFLQLFWCFLEVIFRKVGQKSFPKSSCFSKKLKKQFIRQSYELNELRFLRFQMLNFLGTQKVKNGIFMFLGQKWHFGKKVLFLDLQRSITFFAMTPLGASPGILKMRFSDLYTSSGTDQEIRPVLKSAIFDLVDLNSCVGQRPGAKPRCRFGDFFHGLFEKRVFKIFKVFRIRPMNFLKSISLSHWTLFSW